MIKKNAFTLIEMMVSISILSIMMIFLYQSNASLNISNNIYKKESQKILKIDQIKEIIFLDISLSLYNSLTIQHQDKNSDFITFQTSHSLHQRFNPYVAYIFKNSKLYRVESLKPIKKYPLKQDEDYSIDTIQNIKKFRLYKENNLNKYLTDIAFKNSSDRIIMKIKVLNEY